MFCKNCGAQLQEGSVFCPMCGTNNAQTASTDNAQAENVATDSVQAENVSTGSVQTETVSAGSEQTENVSAGSVQTASAPTANVQPESVPAGNAEPAPKKDITATIKKAVEGFGVKKIGIIAVAVVAVIVLIALISGGSSKGMAVSKKMPVFVGHNYFMDANGNAKEFDDVYASYTSADRSVVLYLDDESSLYILDKNLKEKEIASDVTSVRVGRNGKYVAYLANEDSDYYSQTLYIYDVKKDKSKEIDDEVYGDYLTISVSGESVAYIKDYDYDSGDFDTYVAGYTKEPKKIASDDGKPVAVSDNAKKAYFLDKDRTLYYFNGKDKQKVTSDVSYSFWTNSDLSELVFAKDGDTYFCKPGKDEVKIGRSSFYSVIYPSSYMTCYLGNNTQALLNDTIKGQVVYGDDGNLYWVNKKATEMEKLDKNVGSVLMSEDGSSVVYVSKSKVYRIDKFKADVEPKLLYDEDDISYIVASNDLKKVYGFSYDDDAVYYFKNSKKAVKLREDVDSMAFNYGNDRLYLVSDEELFEAKTSESSVKKVSVDGDVYSVSSSLNGVFVYSSEGSDYVCDFIGKKTIRVYED